ncbi:hypothetical protein AVBRAN12640_05005, partial [Campylobacter sp. RM12640]|uniref:hypothetical protein n=1 Tax=unclassified Campylobacter TaxID=2593542 RepID=UPI0030147051|nr:hypothetical protein [Campylobacter sp. RM12640]MBZ7988838.1 hypothetical protein [Campylobacter sp. RM12635]
ITLSSDIKAENTNSNSKNTLQTSEQIEIKEEINNKVVALLEKEDDENSDNNKEDEENNDNDTNKPDMPIVPSEPVYNKYFSNADNKNYYYSSNTSLRSGDVRQDAAELNVKKGSLNILSNTKSGNNITDFKKISVTNNQLNILKTTNDANSVEDFSYSLTDTTISGLDGYSDLKFSANDGKVSYTANKEKLEANILDDSFSMLKDTSTNSNYNAIDKEWGNFTNTLFEKNKDYFNVSDLNKVFYYGSNKAAMQLNLKNSSIAYYYADAYEAKKLYADFKYANQIYYENAKSSGSSYDKQTYDVYNKTISPINGSSTYNIQANASNGIKNQDFALKADKNKAEINFGSVISSLMDTQLDPQNRFQYFSNEFDKYKDTYKSKYLGADEDKEYFYAGSGSSIKLNPAKQEVDSYVVYDGGYGNIFRVTFDKNIGDATYVKRVDGRVQDVKHSQKFNINSIRDVNSGYALTVGDSNNDYNFEVKADKVGASLKGNFKINGANHNVDSGILQYVNTSEAHKLVKDTYDKAVQGK